MSNQDDRLDKIERGLYSRIKKVSIARRHSLSPENTESPLGWSEDKTIPAFKLDPETDINNIQMFKPNKKISKPKIFLFASVAFFLIALSFIGYKFFIGGNMISADNVSISINSPINISAGETLKYSINIKNSNSVDLNSLNYVIEYPDGTREVNDISRELKRTGADVGVLRAGDNLQKSFESVLFGSENDTKTIKVTVEYHVPGSSAVFHKIKTFDVLISSSPVSISVSGLKEISSGQVLTFHVDVRSNSTKVIKDLLLQAVFPFGFTLQKSVPEQSGLNIWNIGDLEPGGVRQLTFTGTVEGQNEEERIFKFTVGLKKVNDNLVIGTPFFSLISPVLIQKPFIGVSLSIGNDSSNEYVASAGQVISTNVLYKNNLTTKIFDPEILIKLKGNILNRSSINVSNGYYSSINNTIIFSKENSDSLAILDPGITGNLDFTFSAYPFGTVVGSNQEILMEVVVKGRREQGSDVPQEVLSTTVKKVKIISDLALSSKLVHNIGQFKNFGPIPPKAEKETSYTVIWSLSNTFNDVGDVSVSASLPSYVRWLGNVSGGENITYNPIGKEIIWKTSDIKAGTGMNSSPKQVSFQIAITPSLSQVGTSPIILTNSIVRGIDKFTNVNITHNQENLTTDITGEPNLDSTTAVVGN